LVPALHRARFVLEDRGRGASAVGRAIKKHPELARFQLSAVSNLDGKTRAVLTNVEGHHTGAAPLGFVSPEILLALVRAVPRSYPFWDAEIFFTEEIPGQPASSSASKLPALEGWNLFGEAIPHVSFQGGWRPSGYKAFVHATLCLGAVEAFGAKLPPLPPSTQECLAPFGNAKTILRFRRTDAEAAAFAETSAQLQTLRDEWRDRVKREMSALSLPHDLPIEGTGAQYNPLTLPHKPALVHAFKPRGYRYLSAESGRGCFALGKLTENRNRLLLDFDLGSQWHHYSGGLTVEGANGRCHVELPAHPQQRGTSYDIGSDETWLQLVENVALLVDHLERVFVPQVERHLGRTPDWYEW
jgi:hypothetical protein